MELGVRLWYGNSKIMATGRRFGHSCASYTAEGMPGFQSTQVTDVGRNGGRMMSLSSYALRGECPRLVVGSVNL